MPYFNAADRTQLFYATWGTGYPVLFVHGANVGSDIWNCQLPYLVENGFQCIVYDQRGFSRSDCPSVGYDFDTLASDLNGLIEHLNLKRFSVVTFSFGACVVARYLSNFGGEEVDQAILIAPTTPFFLKTLDNPEGLDREIAYEPFRLGMQRNRPQLFRDSIDSFLSPSTAENLVSDAVKEWLINLALQSPLMPMLELGRTSGETDFRGDMKAFTMPTLILHGDADMFAPAPFTGLLTHKLISNSQFVLYSGASHGILFTHCDRLNHDIAEFIRYRLPEPQTVRT